MTNTGGVPATQRDGGILRPLLWAVLAIGVVGNICFSGAGMPMAGNIAFSTVSLVGTVGLIVHHYRTRR
ncbi:hypothetical protein [Actinomadura madurae]|uniref:hypothetical protein n=1 Tax=Actinomadura madurae TaxID=1993 RepID=UPI002026DFF8|nr:hypothetical protein [Actinomadura madurae]MCP9951787.1 hypothetical protein [Actinomadura madurae]MCP9968557.1 hypothetical protein [Actinomadura madurae]MCP9981026.1 hypothetical protein [Actinomadura madurae]MCQ0007472.1 hypothetical protein [Actinomadura madurae]MCQ0017223.1 hypothetical protein [Actinomadura madurae]